MHSEQAPFFVHAERTFRLDAVYRVYPTSTETCFVRINGPGGRGRAIAGGTQALNPLQALIAAPFLSRTAVQLDAAAREFDTDDPRDLVAKFEGSFIVPSSDVLSATLDDERAFGGNGPQYGVWNLVLSSGNKLKLKLGSVEDSLVALAGLPAVFGNRLTVNFSWNPTTGTLQKHRRGMV